MKKKYNYKLVTAPTGTIQSFREFKTSKIRKLKNEKYWYTPDETELKEIRRDLKGEKSPDLDEEMALFAKGHEDEVIAEDPEPYVMEMVTTDGTFLLIAENIDGHASISVFQKV